MATYRVERNSYTDVPDCTTKEEAIDIAQSLPESAWNNSWGIAFHYRPADPPDPVHAAAMEAARQVAKQSRTRFDNPWYRGRR